MGIHGTNQGSLIARPSVRGCVRMRNADVLKVSAWVPIGSPSWSSSRARRDNLVEGLACGAEQLRQVLPPSVVDQRAADSCHWAPPLVVARMTLALTAQTQRPVVVLPAGDVGVEECGEGDLAVGVGVDFRADRHSPSPAESRRLRPAA